MQETPFLNKNIQLYQRRRHKLFRALAEADSDEQLYYCSPRQQLISLYETAANKENQISQIGYFVKHQLTCSLNSYAGSLMQILWTLIKHRDGTIVAFLIYRICRKYPSLFWKCFIKLNQNLQISLQNKEKNRQMIVLYTDLFLYGFPFTIEDFQLKIFPRFEDHSIDLVIKYKQILISNVFFSLKLQKIFSSSFNEWLQLEKSRIVQNYEKLLETALNIQEKIIHYKENEVQSSNYELELQKFETEVYHFLNAANKIGWSFDASPYKLKTIFQLKKECKTFKSNFQLSAYESSLYVNKGTNFAELKPLKKHEMTKIQQSDAFINQMKLCSDQKQCINLSGYFLEQMNLHNNREYLVQTIINDCYNYNNISYLLKILAEISQVEPSLADYCSSKAKKICSSAKMNTKYQKLLCEMTKYQLIHQNILLQYCEKILKNQNSQTMKQVQSILQNMGGIVYYRSLQTHIRINALFDRLQAIIKTKLSYFSIENLYQLKGLINYLRNHKNNNDAQTHQIAKIQIKEEQNYNFLLSKMQKMIREGQQNKVVDYLICGIDQEEFLTSYYYASLIKDLNSTQIQRKLHQQSLKIVIMNLSGLICQKAVKWSRFLGQLYNYQCITRKQLFQNFRQILAKGNTQILISVAIKCVCSSLQTSRSYLYMNNIKKERQIMLMLLQLKSFYVKYKKELQCTLICEIQELLQFFNPQILKTLQGEEEIQHFLSLCTQFIHSTNNSVSHYISQMANGCSIQNLRFVDQPHNNEHKRKYKQKDSPEKTQRKWVQKRQRSIRFVQKIEKTENEFKTIPDHQQTSKESSVTTQAVEPITMPRKIKVMGRSKKDNKIKTVTCLYSESPSQN